MAKPPRPKFGEPGHEGESMAQYSARVRAWENIGKGQKKPDLPPADETIEEGPGASTDRDPQRQGESKEDYNERTGKKSASASAQSKAIKSRLRRA